MTHWTEDYVLRVRDHGGCFEFVHIPSATVLLTTMTVSMETLNGLMNEFDTYGYIRPDWRNAR